MSSSTQAVRSQRSTSRRLTPWLLGGVAAMGLALAFPSSASAQQAQQGDQSTNPAANQAMIDLGKRIYQSKATCGFCHGWSGDGFGDPHSEGKAASLRKTNLNAEQLFDTIRCGRPGTAMPHYEKFAWTKGEECFELSEADVGNEKPPVATANLQKREINALVAYLMAKVVGRSDPTPEECVEYFGGNERRCQEMREGKRKS